MASASSAVAAALSSFTWLSTNPNPSPNLPLLYRRRASSCRLVRRRPTFVTASASASSFEEADYEDLANLFEGVSGAEEEGKGEKRDEAGGEGKGAGEEEEDPFDPDSFSDDYAPVSSLDSLPPETEVEVGTAYEEMYGTAYSGETFLGGDIYVMDANLKDDLGDDDEREKIRDGFEERVVEVRMVTKVVKGGKTLRYRAIVVVGDKEGSVGVGVGKAREVSDAVDKAAIDARRDIVTVPLTKYSTFPHRADGKYGGAKVMLRPASPGSGVLAGGAVRVVLEMAGVQNALGKQLGSKNALNNARATLAAVQRMHHFQEVAELRGIPMEELWK